jgi:hypothetical protein
VKVPGRSEGFEMTQKGRCIGWEDADSGLLYLEPSACFAEVQALAGQEGEPLPVSRGTLWKRLRERGLIEVEEEGRIAKKVPGRTRGHRGIALQASAVWPDDPKAGEEEGEPAPPYFTGEVA